MVSKLEVGGNIIVSWLVIYVLSIWIGRPSAVDRSRVKEETGRTGGLAGGFRSSCEAKDGSERWVSDLFCEFVHVCCCGRRISPPVRSLCLRNGAG
jgi:hypothetical protein